MNSKNILVGAIVLVVGIIGTVVLTLGRQDSVGGLYNTNPTQFINGFSAGTSNQFAVTSAGAVTSGAFSGTSGSFTTGTFSSTLGVTGATTLSGQTTLKNAVTITGASTLTDVLTIAESGTTFYAGATTTTYILPTATTSAGVHYKFVIASAFDTSNVVIDSADGDNIDGTLIVAGAVVDCDGEDQIDFVNDGENVGDYVEVFSNGVKWFIGDSGALTGSKMTCTDPS